MSTEAGTHYVQSQHGDREFIKDYEETVAMLADMAIELVEDNKAALLSPIFRKLLADKAKEVKAKRLKFVGQHIFVDNPGTPLNKR